MPKYNWPDFDSVIDEEVPMKIITIVDAQFGSTGKGLAAGYFAEKYEPDTIMTAWAPNAGHTSFFKTEEGHRELKHTMLANGIVSKRLKRLMLGPGTVLNVEAFMIEWNNAIQILPHLKDVAVYIHEAAMVLTDEHRRMEASEEHAKIGSTRKGSGAALMMKIARKGTLAVDSELPPVMNVVDAHWWNTIVNMGEIVQIEGAQGFSLGINRGFWPKCTSRECTPQQLMVDLDLPRRFLKDMHVVGVARTFPIRVANRYDADGNMTESSGPCYEDQREITFEDIGVETEYTTVTKLPRRVFTFSQAQIKDFIEIVEPDEIFLNFANYCDPSALNTIIHGIEQSGGRVAYIGRGPLNENVEEK
jgi:adenylosuccinate synthase